MNARIVDRLIDSLESLKESEGSTTTFDRIMFRTSEYGGAYMSMGLNSIKVDEVQKARLMKLFKTVIIKQ